MEKQAIKQIEQALQMIDESLKILSKYREHAAKECVRLTNKSEHVSFLSDTFSPSDIPIRLKPHNNEVNIIDLVKHHPLFINVSPQALGRWLKKAGFRRRMIQNQVWWLVKRKTSQLD